MSQDAITNKLKVAIIGCGRVSEKHIRAVTGLSDRLSLCALVDNNPDAPSHLLSTCKKMIKKYKDVCASLKTYIDYKEMLKDMHPDIVAITVPSGLHFQIAKDCLEANANILLEKPMTMSNKSSRELYELARAKDFASRWVTFTDISRSYLFFTRIWSMEFSEKPDTAPLSSAGDTRMNTISRPPGEAPGKATAAR